MKRDTMLMDSLYNASKACTGGDKAKQTYGQGVLVGLVSALMATGLQFTAALECLAEIRERAHWYRDEREMDKACVPVSWRDDWDKAFVD